MADAPMALSFWRRVRGVLDRGGGRLAVQATTIKAATTYAERRSMEFLPETGFANIPSPSTFASSLLEVFRC
jgi:hypothetical protein